MKRETKDSSMAKSLEYLTRYWSLILFGIMLTINAVTTFNKTNANAVEIEGLKSHKVQVDSMLTVTVQKLDNIKMSLEKIELRGQKQDDELKDIYKQRK